MQNIIGPHEGIALVPPQGFSSAMKQHWTTKLGLCSSRPLERLWTIMATTFNDAIRDASSGISPPWRILQPPTGSGKTQGACLFAAMQSEQNMKTAGVLRPVGMIIVTRLISEADDIVKTINDHAGRQVAIAHHSGALKTLEELHQHDALVITHQAIIKASTSLNASKGLPFERLKLWRGGERLLTIIDEALANVVENAKVTADNIAEVQRYISRDLETTFRTECVALKILKGALCEYAALPSISGEGMARGFLGSSVNDPTKGLAVVNFTPLRTAMKTIRYDQLGAHEDDCARQKRIGSHVDRTLESAQAIFDQWAYYARKGPEHSFNSAALSVPWGAPGPVVMDATARSDFLWDLLEDRQRTVPTPSHVRDYGNVTLHVARCAGVGKRTMTKNFRARFSRLASDLEERLEPSRRVFLCTHQANEHVAKQDGMGFDRFAVGHWGAVDGRNDWADYDTAVIFGLSYRDHIWANNTFMALKGVQDDDWLKSPAWKTHTNVRRVMQQRQLSVSIIQAINRIRCRRVIDEQGGSPVADIFIVLPPDEDGNVILRDITLDMPGIKVAEWDFQMDGPKVRRPRKGSSHEALLSWMASRMPGSTPMTKIGRELGLKPKTLKNLKEALRDPLHDTTQALTSLNVTFLSEGAGRGAKSFLVKS